MSHLPDVIEWAFKALISSAIIIGVSVLREMNHSIESLQMTKRYINKCVIAVRGIRMQP